MRTLTHAVMYWLVGLVVSAFPFAMFSVLGIVCHDAFGILSWPAVAAVYGVAIWFAQRKPK